MDDRPEIPTAARAETAGVPVGRRLHLAAEYAIAVLLCLLLLVWSYRLWEADLRVPLLYDGDGLFGHVLVKGLIDHGWYLRNKALGAPIGLDLRDFPLADGLFLALLKGISLAARDWGLTVNLYFFLTFPLTTVTALYAMRRLGVSYAPALSGALLYAFLPYHFARGEGHLFLASYFLIPPMVLVLVRILLDRGVPLRREGPDGVVRWDLTGREARRALVLCLLMGSGGIYYAVFSCFLLLIAGLVGGLNRRRTYPLVAACLLIGVIGVSVAANLIPKVLLDLRLGPNEQAITRYPFEAEIYGLRFANLLLPGHLHRLRPLAELRTQYLRTFSALVIGEADHATLGILGSLGFLLLIGRFPAGRRTARLDVLDALAVLNLFAVLLAVAGGFGPVLNFLGSPLIRCYNRMSIFIGFFALCALAVVAEGVRPRLASRRGVLAYRAALAVILLVGLLDQIAPGFVPPYGQLEQAYRNDAEFIRRIESALPRRAMVFQLPSISFPEASPVGMMSGYDHFRGYLHSRRLRWSHGAMRGRGADGWRSRVADRAPEELVPTLAYAGFGGSTSIGTAARTTGPTWRPGWPGSWAPRRWSAATADSPSSS